MRYWYMFCKKKVMIKDNIKSIIIEWLLLCIVYQILDHKNQTYIIFINQVY